MGGLFLMGLSLLLGSKETFISYGPPLMLLAFLAHGRRGIKPSMTLVAACAAAGLFLLSIRTGYTAKYSLSVESLKANLSKAHLATLTLWIACVGILATHSMALWRSLRAPHLLLSPSDRLLLLGAVGVLSSSLVVMPWSSSDYYLSLLAPWILALVVGLLVRLKSLRRAPLAMGGISMVFAAIGIFNLEPQIARTSELREVISLLRQIRTDRQWQQALFDSCNESRDSLDLFSRPQLFPYDDHAEPQYFVRSVKQYRPQQPQLWIEAQGCPSPLSENIASRHDLYVGRFWRVFSKP